MTKKDYITKKQEFLSKIEGLYNDLKTLESTYIESNKPFDVGEVVSVVNGESVPEKGIVDGYEISYIDEIVPVIKKIKKDGTKSQHKLWVWSTSKIYSYII